MPALPRRSKRPAEGEALCLESPPSEDPVLPTLESELTDPATPEYPPLGRMRAAGRGTRRRRMKRSLTEDDPVDRKWDTLILVVFPRGPARCLARCPLTTTGAGMEMGILFSKNQL
jgi:hypothetical protein